jgi:RNA-directed DNA polymerase
LVEARAAAFWVSTSEAFAVGDVWYAQCTPKLKKRTALLRKLEDGFRRYQSQPVDRIIKSISPMLRGWVAYFAGGNSSESFGFIKGRVEKKIRRHMARAPEP